MVIIIIRDNNAYHMSNFKLIHVKMIINQTLLNYNYESVDPNIGTQSIFLFKYRIIGLAARYFAGMVSFDKDYLPITKTYFVS